ncbi:MAG: LicD family protein [Clostridia bacterium]
MHHVLLEIMEDIDTTCRRHKIQYMLGGGSCLGAVRHKGFIPWDDDMDIMMYYEEMLALHKFIQEDYGNKYLSKLPYEGQGPERMMKIYLINTKDVEISKENFPSENMIFIDVFPIVNLPKPGIRLKFLNKLHYLTSRLYSVSFDSKYPSSTIMQASKENLELKKYYNMRRRLGFFARITGVYLWRNITRKLENGVTRNTGREGFPSGISYSREIFESGFFRETIEVDFEGRKFFIPKNYDGYLKNLYHDYMEIPPVDKRERHIAVALDFGQYGDDVTVERGKL